ncbi:apolipoprotein A-IV-like [Mobula hypostoma]|uniref:apolipoprotein A-IV-like n=1 Tax=Mobula hypostoma TaxID=723540 RepID=UPI002FC34276
MKVLALLMVLTLVLGSQGYLFPWQEEHRTRFEKARDAFWEYVARMSNMAEETLETVKQSELGRDINERIAQSVSSANLYAAEVSEKVRPLAQELVEQLRNNAETMRQQIAHNLAEVSQRLSPYAEQLQEQLSAHLTELGRTIKERADTDAEALSRELREAVQLSVEAFKEKMAPYSSELQLKVNQGIEQFQQGLVPFVEEMQARMVQRAQELQENLRPYAEDVMSKVSTKDQDETSQLSTYEEDVQEKINTILEEIQQESDGSVSRLSGPWPRELEHHTRMKVPRYTPTMKLLVAVLVSALIVASRASQEPSYNLQAKWEEVLEKVWSLANQVLHSTEAILSDSQLGSQFRELITESLAQLNTTAEDLRSRLGPKSEEFRLELERLQERLERDLSSLQSTVEQYQREGQLLTKQSVSDAHHTLSIYLRKYRKRLSRDQDQIRLKLQEYQELLESQGQQVAEGLRQALEPVATEAANQLQERLDSLRQGFQQRLAEVQRQTLSLQERASQDAQGLRNALEEGMASLRSWLQAEAEKLTSHFQDLLDGLREQPAEEMVN